ncbi:MAG: oxidoreductase [Gammaproteobacteria bacterium]|nr:oxidoreductase [Gammaproteobacteria bacterium]MDP2139788.1 oxidoreductase [Gammaproteobacteria bacterium]MDP2346395.1 oxidoreductase [Gammaproteobacteria bacterium]
MRAASPTLAKQLWFIQPHQVEVREQMLPMPAHGELLVQTLCSAISAGTEMLVYRGHIPAHMALDASIDGMQEQATYPLQYGYACVGRVLQVGADVDSWWLGKVVFSFQPHASHFIAARDAVIPLPDGIAPEAAVFLPNMETAINLVQDGNPQLGERVVVLGQGVVGLLLAHLLAQFPLQQLSAVDGVLARCERALQLGVHQVFDPVSDIGILKSQLAACNGADLIYEVSGAPEALNLAIDLSGFASRIVIGSWYGNKSATVALGGNAHRNRLQIITSQVSTIAPQLSGRWDKERRYELGWKTLHELQPQKLITHRVPLSDAVAIYKLLHEMPADVLQAVFTYKHD